jgi:hypothetical protein
MHDVCAVQCHALACCPALHVLAHAVRCDASGMWCLPMSVSLPSLCAGRLLDTLLHRPALPLTVDLLLLVVHAWLPLSQLSALCRDDIWLPVSAQGLGVCWLALCACCQGIPQVIWMGGCPAVVWRCARFGVGPRIPRSQGGMHASGHHLWGWGMLVGAWVGPLAASLCI